MYFLFFLFLSNSLAIQKDHTAESELMEALFLKYDKNVRPVYNASTTTNLTLSVQLLSIEDIDTKQQKFISNIWLTLQWVDEFLTWDPSYFENITAIRVPVQQIWSPDVVVLEEVHNRQSSYPTQNAVIFNYGKVLFVPALQLSTICKLNLRYFPFDHHLCTLSFTTWTYSGSLVRLSKHEISDQFDLLSEFQESHFQVKHGNISLKTDVYDAESYYTLIVHLGIARRPLNFIYTLIWPSVLVSSLTLVNFRLSPESGEKIALGVTNLLVFHVLLSSVGERMPESSNTVPLLAIYLGVVMSLSTLSILMSVFVLNLYSKGNSVQLPNWMRFVFLDNLAEVFSIKRAKHYSTKAKEYRRATKKTTFPSNSTMTEANPVNEIEDQETAEEWKMVALLIDRMLFYVFLFVFLCISLVLLVLFPQQQIAF